MIHENPGQAAQIWPLKLIFRDFLVIIWSDLYLRIPFYQEVRIHATTKMYKF